MPTLHFSSSTNIKDLVGRRLVTNKISAIFELVKNSFDADADEVKVIIDPDKDLLIIQDDGIGMALDDIKERWMVIGTDNKKGVNYTAKGRPINGEKGIGRFSVDRLGSKLKLISRKENSNQTISLEFDWGEFEDKSNTLISDIPIQYFINSKHREKKGVTLSISGLRDIWTETEIKSLEKRLKGMLSPFSDLENNSFKIVLDCKKFGFDEKVLEPYRLDEISSLWVEMSVDVHSQELVNCEVYRNGALIEEKSYPNNYNFGPVKIVIYSFDKGDKQSFYHRFKEHVKDYGNIRIYRDFFQIYPYGESQNDWLELELRKSQGHYRYLGVRDIIGFIQIYREHNVDFIDATNRQGLEETKALDDLRKFVKDEVMTKVEEYFFFKKFKSSDSQHIEHRVEITEATKRLNVMARDIKKFSPDLSRQVVELAKVIRNSNIEQDKIIKNQQQLVEVYKRLASKETLLQGIIHQVLIRLQNLQTAVWNQRADLSDILVDENLIQIITSNENIILETAEEIKVYLVDARNYLLKKRERIEINLYDQLNRICSSFSTTFSKEGIEYTIIGPTNVRYRIDLNDLKVIIENLISNSIKSLKKVGHQDKNISITYEVSPTKLNIFFRDNGTGIEEKIIPHIFTPFYTTTEDGFGMGLAIIDELVKNNNGEINLIKSDVGAAFQISFNLGD
ncbi:signal transduction histidine kinase [Fontibacillus solani]|uniref:histidine kinase n=1 Tax=Fontibacillus solani TaxID=1572857 RepID=A0A7W3SRK6_9BACL|nr:sensor histidine kinase [Fontibacillus solani]MBA9084940.1 signal transduction histidine kinase [Fontibacillus solani]